MRYYLHTLNIKCYHIGFCESSFMRKSETFNILTHHQPSSLHFHHLHTGISAKSSSTLFFSLYSLPRLARHDDRDSSFHKHVHPITSNRSTLLTLCRKIIVFSLLPRMRLFLRYLDMVEMS